MPMALTERILPIRIECQWFPYGCDVKIIEIIPDSKPKRKGFSGERFRQCDLLNYVSKNFFSSRPHALSRPGLNPFTSGNTGGGEGGGEGMPRALIPLIHRAFSCYFLGSGSEVHLPVINSQNTCLVEFLTLSWSPPASLSDILGTWHKNLPTRH